MYLFATGAAFVDRSGAVVAADPGFLAELELRADDPTGTLRAKAAANPELRALLSVEGPTTARVRGPEGRDVEVERIPSAAGALLVLRSERAAEWLEEAMRSHGLARLVGGVAHDIKNPLNAMALQTALLGEKLATSPEASTAAAPHLLAVRDQISRVNEVLRRFLDVAEPGAPLGYTDLGAMLDDMATLFGHEGRRRRITLAVDAQPGNARTSADPARVGRLVLGLFARALSETPDGGRLAARAELRGSGAVVAFEHTVGVPDPDLECYTLVADAAAKALGGRFALDRREGGVRFSLALPRIERE